MTAPSSGPRSPARTERVRCGAWHRGEVGDALRRPGPCGSGVSSWCWAARRLRTNWVAQMAFGALVDAGERLERELGDASFPGS